MPVSFNKMRLVPGMAQPPRDSTLTKLDSLGQKMQDIIKSGKSSHRLVQKFQQLLMTYLHYLSTYKSRVKPPLAPPASTTAHTTIGGIGPPRFASTPLGSPTGSQMSAIQPAHVSPTTSGPPLGNSPPWSPAHNPPWSPVMSTQRPPAISAPWHTANEVSDAQLPDVSAVVNESRVANIISAMTQRPDIITHTPQGQLVYHGKTIPGTNIIELMGGLGEGRDIFQAGVQEALGVRPSTDSSSDMHYSGFSQFLGDPPRGVKRKLSPDDDFPPAKRVRPTDLFDIRAKAQRQRREHEQRKPAMLKQRRVQRNRQRAAHRAGVVVDDVAQQVNQQMVAEGVKQGRQVNLKTKMKEKRVASAANLKNLQRKKLHERNRAVAKAQDVVDVVAGRVEHQLAQERAGEVVDDVYEQVQRQVRMKNLVGKAQSDQRVSQAKLKRLLPKRSKARRNARVSSVVDSVAKLSGDMQRAKNRADAAVNTVLRKVKRDQEAEKYKKLLLSPALTTIVAKAKRQRHGRLAP